MTNNVENMEKVFTKIFSIDCDDALHFDLNSLEVRGITEFKEYHGVNVSVMAYLDKTKVPISIDIGFGDIIYPSRMKMEFPVLLDMDTPTIYTYSISSVIAEKFEAIVSLGDANSRNKDFYDIYVLTDRQDFNGQELKEAIKETFEHRQTEFNDIFVFSDDFLNSDLHQRRWNAFLKKKKALVRIDFEEAIQLLKRLLLPIVESIHDDTEFTKHWNHTSHLWK